MLRLMASIAHQHQTQLLSTFFLLQMHMQCVNVVVVKTCKYEAAIECNYPVKMGKALMQFQICLSPMLNVLCSKSLGQSQRERYRYLYAGTRHEKQLATVQQYMIVSMAIRSKIYRSFKEIYTRNRYPIYIYIYIWCTDDVTVHSTG